jgi:small RNA 2'-O-methyltransferase
MGLLETRIEEPVLGHGRSSTPLHEERLAAVASLLLASGANSVLDLGCGAGALLQRLVAEEQFTRIVGVDTSAQALLVAERSVATESAVADDRVTLIHGSCTDADERLEGFDAAALIETIEHIEPTQLSRVEQAVFGSIRPHLVVVTTPNREYNVLYGIPDGEFRHADHCFEWDRPQFESWARGVSERHGYHVIFADIGPGDAWLGSPTQMGVFRLKEPAWISRLEISGTALEGYDHSRL